MWNRALLRSVLTQRPRLLSSTVKLLRYFQMWTPRNWKKSTAKSNCFLPIPDTRDGFCYRAYFDIFLCIYMYMRSYKSDKLNFRIRIAFRPTNIFTTGQKRVIVPRKGALCFHLGCWINNVCTCVYVPLWQWVSCTQHFYPFAWADWHETWVIWQLIHRNVPFGGHVIIAPKTRLWRGVKVDKKYFWS